MLEIKKGFLVNYLVALDTRENDMLLFNGDQFIWAFDVEVMEESEKFIWECAYYFDDYQIVPPLYEIKQYYNNPFLIKECLCFAIDEENNQAVLQGSNFHYEERPTNKSVLVPNSIEYQGAIYPVTAIANWAFYKDANITDLVLPDSIIKIGNFAFANSVIQEVKMPIDISIGKNAFYGCEKINEKLKEKLEETVQFDQDIQCHMIKKGDVIQIGDSDRLFVLGINGKDCLLFDGNQFIQAYNIDQDEEGLKWETSQVYEQFSDISENLIKPNLDVGWEPEM